MNIFCNSDLVRHDPRFEVFNGQKYDHADKPTRIDSILTQLDSSFQVSESNQDLQIKLLKQVHDSEYIDFLINYQNPERTYPSIYNYSQYLHLTPAKELINLSNYCFDTFTPFSSDIWSIVKESAELALSAMDCTYNDNKVSYALCRPPGHHASIAAQELLNRGKKVCILDIDYHHGNGAQEIWYESDQVLTISIHRDEQFPYFSGKESEKGFGLGLGFNHNFMFGEAVEEEEYLTILQKALQVAKSKNVDYIIVSAGFDTYYQDPICDAKLKIETYHKIAKEIRQLNIATIILQEGGYHIGDLGKCVNSFLKGFDS